MVADKFPNGLIGLIGLNPNGPIGPRTIRTIRTIKMVAGEFPNGLIGLIGLNPNSPIGPNRHSKPCTLLTTPICCQKGCRCGLSQKKHPRDSTRSTARGCLLFGIGRRCALITTNSQQIHNKFRMADRPDQPSASAVLRA